MTVSECTVSDSNGNIEDVQNVRIIVGTIITAKNDPFKFYVQMEKTDKDGKMNISSQEVQIVMPLGGTQAGLFRIPRVGEKVLVGVENSFCYLIGYIPTTTPSSQNFFQTKGMSQNDGRGEVFRYQQTGKLKGNAGEEIYSEIGFYHEKTAWKAADADSYADIPSAPNDYPLIDRINIHSTGDIHESAANHLRTSAKRFELLADCGGVNAGGSADTKVRPFGDADGDDSSLYAGDVHVRAKNRIVLKAGEEIRLQVGRSAVIITDDGITITSKKTQKNRALPWDTVINLTPRDGITLFGQNVNIGAAYNFSLRESAGGAVSSLGGVMRLSARDLLAQSYCKAGYQANTADFIKLYTATAKGMSGGGDIPSYTSMLPSLVQCFSNINWGYYASTSNYADPPGDYAAYCGVLLQILSLTYTSLDLGMSEEQKQKGGRDAFNAAALADQQEKVQEMLKYIDDAGDPARAVHNSFMHLTSSADAVLSGYDNERLSVNVIDSNVPTAGTNASLIAKETGRLQRENSAEATLRSLLGGAQDRMAEGALWALGMDDEVLNKLKEL
jgi:hypothetical protein